MDDLATLVPSAGEVIAKRRREENGEILTYMEIRDLIYWLGETHERARGSSAHAELARVEVRTFLDRPEIAFEVGNQELDDLIAVGLLEGLRLTGTEFDHIRRELPPKMSAWFGSVRLDRHAD